MGGLVFRASTSDRAGANPLAVSGGDMELGGIHHLTAVSAKIRDNHRFYTQTLGMRLVKRTVNQDDVERLPPLLRRRQGQPGHRPHLLRLAGAARAARHALDRAHRAARRRRATRSTGGRRSSGEQGVTAGEIVERDGRLTLDFEDPEGQRLALIDDGGAGDGVPVGPEPGPGRAPDARARPDHAERAAARADRRACCSAVWRCARCASTRIRRTPSDTVHVYEMGPGGAGRRAARRRAAATAGRRDAGRGRRAPRRLPHRRMRTTTRGRTG